MKLELLAKIIETIRPFLKPKIVFCTILTFTLVFWVAHLFPQLFVPIGLDSWYANNTLLIEWGVIIASVLMIITLLIKLDEWVSGKIRVKQEKRQLCKLLQELSHKELVYLFQYIKNDTLLIEFDETDPVVGSLRAKGFIYPLMGVHIGLVVKYNTSYHSSKKFEIPSKLYDFLMSNPKVFNKLLQKP